MFNPFKVADGLFRASVHTVLAPVRMVAEPILSGGDENCFDSLAKSGRRIGQALKEADHAIDRGYH